jgi:hypothetical protein
MNDRGRSYGMANDVATGVRVISGPREGWLGRSFYNIKEVGLKEQDTTVTTTLWNFHNWLTNFSPWSSYGLNGRPYWGSNGASSYQTVDFSVPNSTSLNWAKFIINSVNTQNGNSYSATVNINGHNYAVNRNQFQYLYTSSGSGVNYRFYNNMTQINTAFLNPGSINNLYVRYTDVNSANDMSWFSLIANYTTSMVVPQGVVTKSYYFDDLSGLAYSATSNQITSTIYNLNTGQTTTYTNGNRNRYRYTWYDYTHNHPSNVETYVVNQRPFVLTGTPGNYAASAIAIEKDIDNTDAGDIKDAYVVLNPYGGVDGAMVEVYHPATNTWDTAFRSDLNTGSGTNNGYGNLPGIINLKGYMDKGYVNKVRITVWDNVPQSGSIDYDLVGLTNCYVTVSSTKLPIWWDEFAVDSDQSSSGIIDKDITYEIRSNKTKEAYLFFSGGLDTENVKVEYTSGNTGTLYDGAAP